MSRRRQSAPDRADIVRTAAALRDVADNYARVTAPLRTLADNYARVTAPLRTLADEAGVPFADVLAAIANPAHTPEAIVRELNDLADQRREEDAARWRRAQARLRAGAAKARTAARPQSNGARWAAEVDRRRTGLSREAAYQRIEAREGLRPGTVKKAVLRFRRK